MNDHTSNSDLVDTLALELADAERGRCPIEPLSERTPSLSVEDAYAIQRANISRRTRRGARIVGHKIGLTAKVMQDLFNVREPDYGHLLDTMMLRPGEPLDLSELIDPQIEIEPAFVLKRSLSGPDLSIEDVLDATDYICSCFEIIDSRVIDWRIHIQDTVADNGSSARFVLGTQRIAPRTLELQDLEASISLDGKVVAQGNTGAVLGHPVNGVLWLARKLSSYGVELKAGDIVLPGTCTRSCRIAGHRLAVGHIAGLGEVSLPLANAPHVKRTDTP